MYGMSSLTAPPMDQGNDSVGGSLLGRGNGSAGRSLLTAQDVATMLGVPSSWVYTASREGRIPTVKLGRYYRYRRDAIDEWIASQEVAA